MSSKQLLCKPTTVYLLVSVQLLSANSPIDEVHLSDDVDEVEDVADEVLQGVEVVHVESLLDVLHQDLALLLALLQVQSAA